MDYNNSARWLDGPAGIFISSLLLASIRQPVVMGRPDINVPSAFVGRAGPFETCVNATSGEEGRCMFAMDCFRARGRHVGICTKGFYFGSCCSLSTYSSSPADHVKRPGPVLVSTSRPPTPENLPRVPIVFESNAIDGPAASVPSDPLDLSFWPDLLADIYSLKPQPINSHQFPYSTFHAPSNQATSNQPSSSLGTVPVTTPSSTTSTISWNSTIPTKTTTMGTTGTTITGNLTTTTVGTTTATMGTTNATTTTMTTMTTMSTMSTSSSSFPATTKPLSSTVNPWAGWLVPGNASAANVTVIYANVTAVSESENQTAIQLESWLEEMIEPTTSISTTSPSMTPTSSTPLAIPPTNSLVPSVDKKRNDTFALLPSSIPAANFAAERDGSTEAVCGKPVYRWPKIVSGENARLGQWPWQVTLQEKTRRGYFHKCGASLLSKEWAITAAHCLVNVQQENLLVRMGGIDFASVDDKWIESRVQPIQHPEFNIQTQLNDIALLKLATPIVAYQSSVLPICLPDADMEFDGTQSFVSGWGRLGEKSPISTRLQYVGVPIINNTECENIYRPINKHIDRQSICAGYSEGLKDSCEGDSGGPMMVFKRGRWVLAGIISWGVGCARPNQPGVSTRVTEYLDWIQSTLTANSLPTLPT